MRQGEEGMIAHRRRVQKVWFSLIVGASWLLVTVTLCALGAPPAYAGYELLGRFATGSEEGDLKGLGGVATNSQTGGEFAGDVYVADGLNHRLTRFTSDGKFLGASGWDVTATGPDKSGVNRRELVKIEATSGTFELEYSGDHTGPLSFDASEAAVQEALNNLTAVQTDLGRVSKGGMVKVIGGSVSGGAEYTLTYEGALGDEEQAFITPIPVSLNGSAKVSTIEEGAPAFEDCTVAAGDVCRMQPQKSKGEENGNLNIPKAAAVDQSTGDVYVFDPGRVKGRVQVFTPDGHFIASFGEQGVVEGGVAVDTAGNVFALGPGGVIKVFRPETPGDYEHYVYTGEEHDIHMNTEAIGVDSSDALYGIVEKSRVVRVEPLDVGSLSWASSPDCESETYNQISALTVSANAGDGDVFFFGESPSEAKKNFIRLGAGQCTTDHKFTQREAFPLPVEKGHELNVDALAISPNVALKAGIGMVRPHGTLYAIDPGEPGFIFGQSPVLPPAVVSEEATEVDTNSATLTASVNSHNSATHYYFQYSQEGIDECEVAHACIEAPAGGGELGASIEETAVSAAVSLSPATTYHFRLVVSAHCNPEEPAEVCEEKGPEQQFTTFASSEAVPPDGRAYELVSPPVKGAGEVLPPSPFAANCVECLPGPNNERFPMQSTADGDSFVYEGGPFATAGEAVNENEYMASRSSSGWHTVDLSPSLESKGGGQGFKGVSSDLSRGVLLQNTPSLSPQGLQAGGVFYPNLYLAGEGVPGGLTPLLTPGSVSGTPQRAPEGNALKLEFGGASSDYSHVVFEANDSLTADAPVVGAGENDLYEWVGGHLRLVSVRPSGEADPGAVLGSGRELGGEDPDYSHAVSNDGSRIFWTDQQNGQVYVRERGEETSVVPGSGRFLTASADGTKVLLSNGQLDDLQSDESTDLTGGHGGFQGILGAGEDLSRIFFVDKAVLTGTEANGEGAQAVEGGDNLYAWSEGTTVFVATLGAGDNSDHIVSVGSDTGDWHPSPADRTAEASPDGRYLAFMAQESLTGYDNETRGRCGTGTEKACYEVFEYDSLANRLLCASCNPTGERPQGSSLLNLINPGSGPLPQPASVLDNGRVFFDSLDTLSPQDKNGRVEDVYEHEPDGLGSCAQADGCILLLSSGTGATDSEFVNATPTGSDVFFTTRAQLVPQDRDDLIDLYDAREPHTSGELIAFPPEAAPADCGSGEECRPNPSGPPSPPAPLSVALSGPGNLAPPPPPPPPSPPKNPTKAELLTKALKACQKLHNKKRRATCAAKARKLYATKASAKAVGKARTSRSSTRSVK